MRFVLIKAHCPDLLEGGQNSQQAEIWHSGSLRYTEFPKKSPINPDTGNHFFGQLKTGHVRKKSEKKSSRNMQVLYIKRKIISIQTKKLLTKIHENHLTKSYEASKEPWYFCNIFLFSNVRFSFSRTFEFSHRMFLFGLWFVFIWILECC